MRRVAATLAGLVMVGVGLAGTMGSASATADGATCGPVSYSPGGLTANITCTYLDGYSSYQVKVLCPNYGWRYGPFKPMGQPNYAACLSASAGEGPVQEVRVLGGAA